MLEVQYHDTEKQKEINRFILSLYRKYGIPLIFGADSHFILPEDAALRDQRLEANHIQYEVGRAKSKESQQESKARAWTGCSR